MKDEENNQDLTYEETTFFGLANISGLKSFKNWSLYWALFFWLLIILFVVTLGDFNNDFIVLSNDLSVFLFSISGGVFGIVIAALSVTVFLFHIDLMPSLLKAKLLHKYLFPFWKAVVLWSICILINLFLIIFNSLNMEFLNTWLMLIVLLVFLYAVFYTVKLTGLVIELALQRARTGN